MKGPWTYRRMEQTAASGKTRVIWPVYRLRDAAGDDVEANREYYVVGRYRAWDANECGAACYAMVFNAVRQ